MAQHVRLVSFNVNGLRPMLKRRRGPLTQVLEDLQAGESSLTVAGSLQQIMMVPLASM